MAILKKILLGIGFIIAILLIMALFLKKDYAIERSITIQKPVVEVFEYIKLLKNQNNYSKWSTMDKAMTKTYSGTDGTVGFISAWDSKNEDVGTGEQEIKKITEGERIDFELRFIKPFEATEAAYMTTTAVAPDQTEVRWGFNGHMAYPTNIWLLFLDFEKMIGTDLEIGLQNLKKELE